MEYTEYTRLLKETDSFISSGRLKEAETAIYQLIIQDISDLDKAALCVKMAFIFDRLGKIDEALSWYEKGTAYEQIYGRFEITEKKAEYLSQVGRSKEAISIYETLSIQPFITEADKDRIHKMIQTLLGKQMREWH
jgi:tetratricopeptide (TPR) repeat protein